MAYYHGHMAHYHKHIRSNSGAITSSMFTMQIVAASFILTGHMLMLISHVYLFTVTIANEISLQVTMRDPPSWVKG